MNFDPPKIHFDNIHFNSSFFEEQKVDKDLLAFNRVQSVFNHLSNAGIVNDETKVYISSNINIE